MDEFFAAVEKRDRPELRGKCLLIGGDPKGRGVVSTASYEARPYGCRSAMPMAVALRKCPHAVVLPVRMGRYAEVSEQVFQILARFTPLIEPLSIDEAFLDVTRSQRLMGTAEQIARDIRQAVHQELGLTASVGVAPNKFLAKLASEMNKPDGLTVIGEADVRRVLDPLPVGRLWGVGPAAEKKLQQLNVRTVGQLRRAGADLLGREFGRAGEHFHRLARGEDDRPVTPDARAKSIGQERTFPVDVAEPAELLRVLLQQVEQVARRLRRQGLRARTVTLKLRQGDFTTRTRSTTLDAPTDSTDALWQAGKGAFQAWASERFRPLRLLGVAASGLERGEGQLRLFPEPARKRHQRLDGALDDIAERFGPGAVRRALELPEDRGE